MMRKSLMKLAAAMFFVWAASVYGGVSVRADYCPDDQPWLDACAENNCGYWYEFNGTYGGSPCYILQCWCESGNSGNTGCCF